MEFDVLIIGAGINGLSAAYHLSRQKDIRVGIIDQFQVGNHFGSSHGASRILRSTYDSFAYINLMHRVKMEEWPQLERDLNQKFLYSNSGCFFGSGTNFHRYIEAITQSDLDIEILDVETARRTFPQFKFNNIHTVVHDRTGGVIAAQSLISSLKKSIVGRGVILQENTRALKIDASNDRLQVITDKGVMRTQKLVIAAGPWINQLIPELNSFVKPIRQTVAYFKLAGPQREYQIGQFPNWAFIGDDENQIFYGLPQFESEGIKVSQHITHGPADDPRLNIQSSDQSAIEVLKKYVRDIFIQPINSLVSTETCFYTNTPREDFIIDFLPNDQRIIIDSVCSGHGFKFAPLTGLIVSELVLQGKTTIVEFEAVKKQFSYPPH